jgi:signal transduction histidine kinase
MRIPRFNRTLINYAIVFSLIIAIVTIVIYASLSNLEEKLIDEKQKLCVGYLEILFKAGENEIFKMGEEGVLDKRDLEPSERSELDRRLASISHEVMKDIEGIEGGYYLLVQDDFFGYAYPTSPPPVPVYGPPPRSYNIIKEQALLSAKSDTLIIGLHSFNVAIFPLATRGINYNSQPVGAVWVRIHIQNDLPVIKLKQIVYITAIFSVVGFIILVLISSVWAGEIRGIKRELQELGKDASYRLKERWGIFTYISRSVNIMLDTIEGEDKKRQLLEKKLMQKEKMASLGTVIAGVAHEVKTPLAIIKTRIQMWQKELQRSDGEKSSISPESMQMVIDETNRLSSLVNRLLIFSRPIEKKLRPAKINTLLDDVIRFLDYGNRESMVKVERDFNSELPEILIDENSIKQVFINLLTNSFEALPDGGKIIVKTDFEKDKESIVITISDNGKGIPEEYIDEIFVPFFTLKDKGSGLGLAISDQIVKAHNGEIVLVNSPIGGIECVVRLPVIV